MTPTVPLNQEILDAKKWIKQAGIESVLKHEALRQQSHRLKKYQPAAPEGSHPRK